MTMVNHRAFGQCKWSSCDAADGGVGGPVLPEDKMRT